MTTPEEEKAPPGPPEDTSPERRETASHAAEDFEAEQAPGDESMEAGPESGLEGEALAAADLETAGEDEPEVAGDGPEGVVGLGSGTEPSVGELEPGGELPADVADLESAGGGEPEVAPGGLEGTAGLESNAESLVDELESSGELPVAAAGLESVGGGESEVAADGVAGLESGAEAPVGEPGASDELLVDAADVRSAAAATEEPVAAESADEAEPEPDAELSAADDSQLSGSGAALDDESAEAVDSAESGADTPGGAGETAAETGLDSSGEPLGGELSAPEAVVPGDAEPESGGEAAPGEVGGGDEEGVTTSDLPDLTEDAALAAALEALLLVVDSPAEDETLADALDQPVQRVREALVALSTHYHENDRGIDLRNVGGGWRFHTRDTFAPFVEKMLLGGQRAKLTRAALESLAVIAYRQPVTRARVAAVRGVNVDGVIRTLVTRGLIEESGTDRETGGILYRTTELFLERLGLSSLEDLPPIAPLLPEVDAIDDV